MGSLRSNELSDLQHRMGAALARIAELELAAARSGGHAGPRPMGMDDTRAVIKDAKLRKTPRMSPRNQTASPTGDGGSAGGIKLRGRQALEGGADEALIKAGLVDASPEHGAGKIGAHPGSSGSATAYWDSIMQALGVQTLSAAAIAAATAGAQSQRWCGYELYAGQLRGTPASVWRLTIAQPLSQLELYRAYSRFCAAHPNVCAILGTCVEPLDSAEPMDEDDAGLEAPSSGCGAWADALEGGCHLWIVEERYGDENLAARLERGLVSWQQVCCCV